MQAVGPMSMTLTDGQVAEQYWTILGGGRYLDDPNGEFIIPPGDYVVTWEGEGSLTVLNSDLIASGPGSMTVRYDGNGELILVTEDTDPSGNGSYIRNISVMRPDAVEGERFNRTYLDFVEPFNVIRPLHMTGEYLVYGPRVLWEDRRPVSYGHWGGTQGAPFEVMIDLANQSDSDLWLNLPIAADDEFLTNLADLTRDQLDGSRKLYIELGNEVWNFFPPYLEGRDIARAAAEERWPGVLGEIRPWSNGEPVDDAMFVNSYVGARLSEACNIFKAQWGDQSDRVFCVLAGQFGASEPRFFPNRFLLETPVLVGEEGGTPAAEIADAFSIAPYVGEHLGAEGEPIGFDQTTVDTYFDDAIDYVRGRGRWAPGSSEPEPSWRTSLRFDRELASEFDLPLIAYEGGHHFIGNTFTRDVVANHPRMYELYRAFFEVWQEEGGGLFIHYAGIIPRGQQEPGTEPDFFESENFGIIEFQNQPIEDAPKLRAVLDTMTAISQ